MTLPVRCPHCDTVAVLTSLEQLCPECGGQLVYQVQAEPIEEEEEENE